MVHAGLDPNAAWTSQEETVVVYNSMINARGCLYSISAKTAISNFRQVGT